MSAYFAIVLASGIITALWWSLRKRLVGKVRPISVFMLILAVTFVGSLVYYVARGESLADLPKEAKAIGWKWWLAILALIGISIFMRHMRHRYLKISSPATFITLILLLGASMLYLASAIHGEKKSVRTWFGFALIVVAFCLFASDKLMSKLKK